MEPKKKVAAIVSVDTGEILDEINEGDRLRKITSEQTEYVSSHIINFNKEELFVKLYIHAVSVLRKYLTPTEFMFAMSLVEFVSWEDCILRNGTHGNNHIIDSKELAKLLEMDESVVRRLISSLKKKGVIGKHETGTILNNSDSKVKSVYTVNPYIYFRGINVNKSVEAFYAESGWKDMFIDIEN